MSILDLPPAAATADPVILPGLLTGLGIVRRPVPAWVTDPNAVASIASGFYEIDDDLVTRDQPTTLWQIRRRITGWLCFYVAVYQARVAELEALVAVNSPAVEA